MNRKLCPAQVRRKIMMKEFCQYQSSQRQIMMYTYMLVNDVPAYVIE